MSESTFRAHTKRKTEMEDTAKSSSDEIRPVEGGEGAEAPPPPAPKESDGGGGGGWGGWGFSPLSYLSDLQKAATVAAEEISRNAVEAAKTAAKSIGDMQNVAEDSESSKEDDIGESTVEVESEDEHDKRRKAALEKLEKASDESLLGQGLKVIDSSVEKFASGAWQAFGNAWKGGSTFVNRLENGGLPGSPGSVAPSLIEKGKAFTARGIEVLELVGKETMDLLIAETGMEIDKDGEEGQTGEDPSFEEVTFDRCFYIYGGPEQLEELEALANHHTLLFNRRKAKLSSEQKSIYDGKLKQVQQIFNLTSKFDENGVESEKGKEVENGTGGSVDEMKYLHDSSVSKAAELAAGFANALAGLAPNDMIQRTVGRLDSLHSEGVHRLSEMCCFAVSQLLVLGKSIMSKTNKAEDKDVDEDSMNIDWPEDCVERAKIIRSKALLMTGNVEAVSNSFITGISEVAEAFAAAIKASTADSEDAVSLESIHEKAKTFSGNLETDNSTAIGFNVFKLEVRGLK